MLESSPLHVLLIEESPDDARHIRAMLADTRGEPVQVEWADGLAGGLEHLGRAQTAQVDVVLVEGSLLDPHGIATIAATQLRTPSVPIVVLSRLDDEEQAVRLVRGGPRTTW